MFNIVRLQKTEVEKALQEINSKKATSWDRIQPKFIKLAATGISQPLTHLQIYNCCISNGEKMTNRMEER